MKRIMVLLVVLQLCAVSMFAEDATKGANMSGVLCNAKCVAPGAGHASCDLNCTEKSGDIVLVDDQGQIFQIANQDKVALHAGKKVKVKCHPVKDSKDTMYIDSMYLGG